jgi:hypothetical protein
MLVIACLCAACASACSSRRVATPPPVAEGMDPGGGAFRAERVRVHPLTRIIPSDPAGPVAIDAHVELFDWWDHPVKSLGVLRIELFTGPGGIGGSGRGPGLVSAVIDMTDPALNAARFYDSATRTYRFLLEAPRSATGAASPLTLNVTFVSLDGRRMRDSFVIGARPLLRPLDAEPEPEAP